MPDPPLQRRGRVRSGSRSTAPTNLLKPCSKTFSPAKSFADLVALVREAERRLLVARGLDVGERVCVLRGIFYGTTWSTDFKVEQSHVRNTGFSAYTQSTPSFDPTTLFNCRLYEALQGSQDVRDGDRHVDFGHLIIGLDARRSPGRNTDIPMQGGTGVELCTWLGDLGGGAANLAVARVAAPKTRAVSRFRGSDYGGSINLEGDVAGFVVAASSRSSVSEPSFPTGQLADALESYFGKSGPGAEWNGRAEAFLNMYGGKLVGGKLTNRADLVEDLGESIEDFASFYALTRPSFSAKQLDGAAEHVHGASREIAEVFLDALVFSSNHGGAKIEAHGAGPAPSPPGDTNYSFKAAAKAKEIADEVPPIPDIDLPDVDIKGGLEKLKEALKGIGW